MRIYTRAEWGAQYREGWGTRSVGRLNKWEHHSVTTHLSENATFDQECKEVRKIESITQSRFAGGMAYTFLVFPSGRIYQGLGVDRIGTHTAGHNTTAVGICLVGNYMSTAPTAKQEATLAELLNHGVRQGWWKENALSGGHRDVKATSCPGDKAYERIPAVNAMADGSSTPVTNPVVTTPTTPSTPKLAIDGSRGPATIKRWQAVMGTTQDGKISPYPPGSSLIKADQAFLNSVVKAADIRNLTGASRLSVDGDEGTKTIKVRQFWLYNTVGPKLLGRKARVADFDGSFGPQSVKLLQYALNQAKTGSGRY